MVTPEAVLLELPTAGVATRAFARLLDLVLQMVFAMIVVTGASLLFSVGLSPQLAVIVLSFTTLLVLPILVEVLWRGRSPGKALFGLRVVGADGRLGQPLAGVPAVVAQGQGGLLDVITDRDFARNRTLYFCYAEPAASGAANSTAMASAVLSAPDSAADRADLVRVRSSERTALLATRRFSF